MYKIISIIILALAATGCSTMQDKSGGLSTRTKALAGGAGAASVGLIAVPFVGPLLAGAAIWSYSEDSEKAASAQQKGANAAAAAKRNKCAALYEQADKGGWSNAKTNAKAYREGCK